ncbi:MAG: hypothetical protein F6K21_18230 [Symploca sp. SIO2D2]|nr:hypothetical protein [Symploca sp. SIO2D2]
MKKSIKIQNIKARRDTKVVGGNYTSTININIWLLIVGVIAAGSMVLLGIKAFNKSIELKLESNQSQQSAITEPEQNFQFSTS